MAGLPESAVTGRKPLAWADLKIIAKASRPGYCASFQVYRITDTAVARLRLETPADMGMETQWLALAINSRLTPAQREMIATVTSLASHCRY